MPRHRIKNTFTGRGNPVFVHKVHYVHSSFDRVPREPTVESRFRLLAPDRIGSLEGSRPMFPPPFLHVRAEYGTVRETDFSSRLERPTCRIRIRI